MVKIARSYAAMSASLWFFGTLGCGAPKLAISPENRPPEAGFRIRPDANFELVISEAVSSAEEDADSYAKVYLDGFLVAQTSVGLKSQGKVWGERLAVGNHLFRLELWNTPRSGEGVPLDAQWQPQERFIRIEEGTRAKVALKFFDGGHNYSYQISREPLTQGK